MPVVLIEYAVLIWFMGRGLFPLVGCIVVFALCLGLHIWLIRRFRGRTGGRAGFMISALVVSPILTAAVVAGAARMFGIEIVVQ